MNWSAPAVPPKFPAKVEMISLQQLVDKLRNRTQHGTMYFKANRYRGTLAYTEDTLVNEPREIMFLVKCRATESFPWRGYLRSVDTWDEFQCKLTSVDWFSSPRKL